MTSVIGYGSDQIVSARMIDAKANIIEVTEANEPDLLWAIRGAGQFFGVVTELVIQACPFNLLGNDQGLLWAGRFVFPLERAREVTAAMNILMNNKSHITAGLMMIMAPPPARKPAIVISAKYVGHQFALAFNSLYDLQPLAADGGYVPIQNANDGHQIIEAQGDYKRYSCVGLAEFNESKFLDIIDIWKELMADCPTAYNTSFTFQWDSRSAKHPGFDSAMSLHDTHFWT